MEGEERGKRVGFLKKRNKERKKHKLTLSLSLSSLSPLLPTTNQKIHDDQEADDRDRQEGHGQEDLQQPVRGREARRGRARGAEEALKKEEESF